MRNARSFFYSIFLLLLAITLLNCGLNHNKYRSLTVSPVSADAKDYPNGQVQFTATATLINGNQVMPANVLWTPNPPWTLTQQTPVSNIFVNSEGLTTCAKVGQGLYPVYATSPIDPNYPLAKMTMNTPQITAMAALTCP